MRLELCVGRMAAMQMWAHGSYAIMHRLARLSKSYVCLHTCYAFAPLTHFVQRRMCEGVERGTDADAEIPGSR